MADLSVQPKGIETSVVTDFFDMMFTSLPHKILMPDKFDTAANELRRRFTVKSDKDYVFRPIYHKRIPADGFPHYAESIWAKIVSNKDLDLPTQQELLAQYRCDEIASVALGLFTDAVMPYRSPIEGGRIVDGLGPAIARARDELMATFDRDASRYHALVYKRKRAELMRAANTTLATFYLGQLKNLGKKALSDFSKDLNERLNDTIGSLGSLNGSFLEHVKCARELAGKYFILQAEAICLRDTEWSYAEQLSQLWEEIDEVATRRRGEEVSKMVASLERTFIRDISEPLSKHLNEPSSTMWARVIEDYKAAYDRAKEKLIRRAKSGWCFDVKTSVIRCRWSSCQLGPSDRKLAFSRFRCL
ncbi:MAG: RHD3/Sey1 [Olpidium bornovanus]|uniref:RHD3/Sey1 n=1 Tax=Olpidium bornovanus TaxID=278681 RepID=A0A8H8DL50_9FUNG|nr:MAG: RHD3/Sey1 [Olpidium bornovanus]